MAKEPNIVKKVAKKPPADQPTSMDQLAGTIDIPAPVAKPRLAPQTEPSEISEIEGKIVRKDPPVGGSTQPFAQDTLATVAPDDAAEVMVMPAQKPSDSGDAPAPTSEKGASTLDHYKLMKKLGQGGMGAVYKAQDTKLDRIVAIKVLAKELSSKEAYVLRFEREARVMVKLDHPNILRAFDVGKAKGFHYLTMEFVEGGSVEGWLKKLGKFSVGDAMHIVLKTAEALQHAHDKSMIHRDIKPDNILLTKDGVIKVADLGLAKDTSEDVSLTKTGAGAGTPIYMAPEQARDVKHVDGRVDIYALGVMMYVFLTGQAPFQGNTIVELITAKEKGKFDPIRKHNSDVPTKVDLIVDKMLAKDPKQRYATCQEVIDQLEPLGLANDELSFITSDKPANGSTSKLGKTTAPSSKPNATQPPSAPSPKTQGPAGRVGSETTTPSAPVQQTQIEEADEGHANVWYWKMTSEDGKKTTKKLSTDQVKALIKAGHIAATAQVSKSATAGFRAAGTFPQFHATFQALDTAMSANVKGHKYRQKMKDAVDEDERRRQRGWISRMFKGVGGTLLGLLWIVLILAIVGAAGYFAMKYFDVL